MATELNFQHQGHADTLHPDSSSEYSIAEISYHSHPSVFCKHFWKKACFPETNWNQETQTLNMKET